MDRSPAQRFRIEQWLDLLPAGAIDAEYRPFFSTDAYDWLFRDGRPLRKVAHTGAGMARRLRDLTVSSKFDVVFVHRGALPLGPPFFEQLASRRVPVVYEFDDAIFLGDTSPANRMIARLKRPDAVWEIVGRAALTIVGNDWLASKARQFSPRVEVIPTTIDIERYRPVERPRNVPLRIGWSGSVTTVKHLEAIEGTLRRVLRELPVELVAVGDRSFHLDGLSNVTARDWSPTTELDDLRSFDIGLMPLPDDDWARGKCGLKALQYMALGIPTIASPVGVNTEIISDGHNGLLASTEDEWVEAIGRLVDDEALARRLGSAGRDTVVERYSGQAWAPRFLDALERTADQAKSSAR
jgi:glycosyltransferase involved in cell wall biosynthesis